MIMNSSYSNHPRVSSYQDRSRSRSRSKSPQGKYEKKLINKQSSFQPQFKNRGEKFPYYKKTHNSSLNSTPFNNSNNHFKKTQPSKPIFHHYTHKQTNINKNFNITGYKKEPILIDFDKKNYSIDPRIALIENALNQKFRQNKFIKLNLVLDLDETLISSLYKLEDISLAKRIILNQKDISFDYLNVKNEDGTGTYEILVFYRPKLKEFLTKVSRLFNIYVYSHGMGKYVNEIINLLDPNVKLINRENIIYNYEKGMITDQTRKCLSKISLNSIENLKKTIIIDDILNVWKEEYCDNIIVSKKFMPAWDFTDVKAKNSNFSLMYSENLKQYLPFGSSYTDFYIDKKIVDDKKEIILEQLGNRLEELSRIYNKSSMIYNGGDELDIKFLLKEKIKSLLKNKKIAIWEIEQNKTNLLMKEIIIKMGGKWVTYTEIFKDKEVEILIIDKKEMDKNKVIVEEIKKIIKQENKDNFRIIKLIENRWLTECYFSVWNKPLDPYEIKLEN